MAILKQGSSGPDVTRLQVMLNRVVIPPPHLVEDGDFGAKTHDAVVQFQKASSLKPDGVVGPQTWTALGQKFGLPSEPVNPVAPSPPPVSGTQGSWLDIAKAELGIHENSLPGENNKRIIEYHSTTTLKATDDETPWCSSFVNWVMKQAGYKGTNSALAKSWLNWGTSLDGPREGAITVIKKKGASSDQATGSSTGFHVAFYVSSTASTVRLLGGNQSDSVKYSNFYLSSYDVKGYRWP